MMTERWSKNDMIFRFYTCATDEDIALMRVTVYYKNISSYATGTRSNRVIKVEFRNKTRFVAKRASLANRDRACIFFVKITISNGVVIKKKKKNTLNILIHVI